MRWRRRVDADLAPDHSSSPVDEGKTECGDKAGLPDPALAEAGAFVDIDVLHFPPARPDWVL